MAYINVDLDEFDDDDILSELESRISTWIRYQKGSTNQLKNLIEAYKRIGAAINGDPESTAANISILDKMKIDLIKAACEKYTIEQLEEKLGLSCV